VLAAIRTLSQRPIHYVVNTSVDADHVGGNGPISKAGRPAPGTGQGLGSDAAAIIAHEAVLNRMTAPSGQQAAATEDAWPSTTFFTPKKTMAFNEEPIEIIWQPAAHSDGDVMVFFRGSDVISVGDLMSTLTYPIIDVTRGGSIQGVIDGLNRIIDITIPRFNQMGGTRVIPGHGRICNEADVVEYRDMVTIIRDRVQALVRKGQTLEQVQAARPTYEYDPMYGSSGTWTPVMFVEAVYRSLTVKPGEQ
jgi:glyoxylase-like metal-dependent hydrolase (beta-lactamase superfamily II)